MAYVLELLCVSSAVALVLFGLERLRSPRYRKWAARFIVAGIVMSWFSSIIHGLRAGGIAWGYAAGVGVVLLEFLIFLFMVVQRGRRRPDGPLDAVVVLGAGLLGTEVTPSLARRLDAGIAVARASGARTVLCSGGKGADEVISEAEAMSRYIGQQAPDTFTVLQEDRSTTTNENISLSAPIIDRVFGPSAKVGIVSSDYHMIRAGLLARRMSLPWATFGARTSVLALPTAVVREFAALVKMYWYWEAIIVGIAGVVAITLQ
ncbi:YdcF family protein [Arcanobacterium phocae]|uniref:Uncharacterized SAM-binding protein YcdF, DUF218 family n=1 Tax=Arcanobacterium phocae TaxID=131112 RepID=A0A1H2LMW6_9ACTO|nr:YdcF family protein [Arcanobacterium phocae]SDU82347.1 Uncharacterized SAM-binding protein YcdF, DUF218 family [Arcanobacterium phocae]